MRIIAANKDMDVAKVENEAAVAQAKAILFKAQAEADVIRMQNIAQAGVIKNQVKAFSTGQNFARYTFYTKVGPSIESILTSDQDQGLGTLFLPFLPQGKELK